MSRTVEGHDELIELLADPRLVLLGEASHGTKEFYATRARLSAELIERFGFRAVAAEADWPDAARATPGCGGGATTRAPKRRWGTSRRFPAWMWRNIEVRDFVEWLRERLGLYSLNASIRSAARGVQEDEEHCFYSSQVDLDSY